MSRRVVVTGLGAVSSLGTGTAPLLDGWLAGRGVRDGAARCRDFDPAAVLERKELRRSDRFSQFALVAADEACREAGWASGLPVDGDRVTVVLGTCFGGVGSFERSTDELQARGGEGVSPLTLPLVIPNAAAALVAMRVGARGPCQNLGTACAAGTDAIGAAANAIASGASDAAIAGGSEACLSAVLLAAGATMGAMSRSGASLPFDRRRDGFVMGEGAGIVTLEAAEVAEARGATILAEVRGYGCTNDAFHLTNPDPSGRTAALAMRRALDSADLAPGDVDYVNAHGTATPSNDRAETEAIKLALGERARSVPVSSTKSVVGHLVGAAGAIEAVATIGALRRGQIPPTAGWEERDADLDLDYVPVATPIDKPAGEPVVALSNSFGFGGHNSVICFAVQRAA